MIATDLPEDLRTWLAEYNPDTPATLALTDLWLENDDNQARVILKAFKIGFEQGKRSSLSPLISNSSPK